MEVSDGSNGLPSAWAYRTRASENFKGGFLKTIADNLMTHAAKGTLAFYMELPLAYRRNDEKGKTLRGGVIAALQGEGYHASFRDGDKHYWREPGTSPWERLDSESETDSPDDKMLDAKKPDGEKKSLPRYLFVSADARDKDD